MCIVHTHRSGTGAVSLQLLAAGLREERLDELVDESMRRLLADEPAYARADRAELRVQMTRTIGLALTRLAGRAIPADLSSAAYESGQLRAAQGIELAAVLHSFRIDLRVLWQAVIHAAIEGGGADHAFVEGLVEVWEAVEANIADVVDGYRDAAERLARGAEEVRAAAFDRLLERGGHDGTVVVEAARLLELSPDARHLCLVARPGGAAPGAMNAVRARLRREGVRAHLQWAGAELLGVIEVADPDRDHEMLGRLIELRDVPCGLAEARGLGEVARGLRLARAAARGADGPRLLRGHWGSAALAADAELAESLVETVLGPLDRLAEPARTAVLETLEACFAGDGSVADIAARTFRHRNTVRRRLQDVVELTGLDPRRPADAALLALALQGRATARRA